MDKVLDAVSALQLAIGGELARWDKARGFCFWDPEREGYVTEWPDGLPSQFVQRAVVIGDMFLYTGHQLGAGGIAKEYGWQAQECWLAVEARDYEM